MTRQHALNIQKESYAMKSKLLIAALLFIFSVNGFAAPAKKETVNAMFEVMHSQKMMDSIYGQIDGMFKQMTQGMDIDESQKPIMDKFFAKYNALLREEMSWEKLKNPMAETYASVYTDREVKEITKFYKSPVGQKVLEKMPELMRASLSVTQNAMKNLMPKIKEIQKEMAEEIKESSAKK
ncbi:DUF2059 domain-containing protein [Undibacterium sp. Ji22W]|uniref:DUF2059 domain-containing protein n=1 Tax=Undibacterium sp. Ji22W TaxID=3413038 RepID=UPI003BF2AB37